MKHAVLTSIGHNIAESLASGIGLMIGVYEIDVYGEAARSPHGFIEVDFLVGRVSVGDPTFKLAPAVRRYAEALPGLCKRQGAEVSDFRKLTARYVTVRGQRKYVVEVMDRRGRVSCDRYFGAPGRRLRVLDPLGRIRRTRRG